MFDKVREDPVTELPFGLKGRVFRGAMPYSMFDAKGAVLDAAARDGVDVVVLLAEDDECVQQTDLDLVALYEARGWTVLKMPVVDQSVSGVEAHAVFRERVLEARALANGGRHILVHCLAGVGRTGTFLACLARVVRGLEPAAAIGWVREYVPGAVEREEQALLVERVVL
ncbi:MAG TPA: protein-tyrosine phosphatase family protein [Polyangiaceae bacterium]